MNTPLKTSLEGRIAIVTGGAQGIGEQISAALIREGATVILADVNAESGAATADTLGDSASFLACDVSKADQVHALVERVATDFGRLDIMVNNAGINTVRPEDRVTVDKYPDETWKRILDVDLNGAFYCCKAASAQMLTQGNGVIINIASVAGVVALRLQIGFVAAKAAVIKMTEAMACELGPLGVRVNAISPGSILTDGTRELFYKDAEKAKHVVSFIPQGRPGEATEIAEAVIFLASDSGAYVNGHNLVVDGGWTSGFNRDF